MPNLPNPFDSATSDAVAEQAAASSSQPPAQDAAADLCEPTTDGGGPKESPASGQELCGAGDLGIDCIGEIFAGARKLEYVPDIFELDPAAITTADHLFYDVLKAMVDPRVPGLRKIPDEQALFEAIEPPPLFLQAVGY